MFTLNDLNVISKNAVVRKTASRLKASREFDRIPDRDKEHFISERVSELIELSDSPSVIRELEY